MSFEEQRDQFVGRRRPASCPASPRLVLEPIERLPSDPHIVAGRGDGSRECERLVVGGIRTVGQLDLAVEQHDPRERPPDSAARRVRGIVAIPVLVARATRPSGPPSPPTPSCRRRRSTRPGRPQRPDPPGGARRPDVRSPAAARPGPAAGRRSNGRGRPRRPPACSSQHSCAQRSDWTSRRPPCPSLRSGSRRYATSVSSSCRATTRSAGPARCVRPSIATASRPAAITSRASSSSPASGRTVSIAVADSRSVRASSIWSFTRAHRVAELHAGVPDRIPDRRGQRFDLRPHLLGLEVVDEQEIEIAVRSQLAPSVPADGEQRDPPPVGAVVGDRPIEHVDDPLVGHVRQGAAVGESPHATVGTRGVDLMLSPGVRGHRGRSTRSSRHVLAGRDSTSIVVSSASLTKSCRPRRATVMGVF